jgi:uncharacterized membrane protein YhaH (DUF805 family)
MNWFIDPIKNHYVDFEGRVARKPFWLFILIYIVISSILSTIGKAYSAEVLSWVFDLALLLPSLAITTRRLHDTSRSGWWQLLWVIPVIGWIVLIVFLAQDSTPADNAYGATVKGASAPVVATAPEGETKAGV